jgi:acetyl esterase/lipase
MRTATTMPWAPLLGLVAALHLSGCDNMEKPPGKEAPVVPVATLVPRLEEKKPALGDRFDLVLTKDVAYYAGEGFDPIKHKLDIYVPRGQKDFPVLFFIHGGKWRESDRKEYAGIGQQFARNGVGTVVISYRLSPGVMHPAHVQDVARAFAWTVRNIGTYGGNPREIFVSGFSSGGHLAALLATNERFLKAERVARADIKGVISLSGVYRITSLITLLMPSVFDKDDATLLDASPLQHVQGTMPPFLICYAESELTTLDSMAEEFCQAIRQRKGEANTLKVARRTHVSLINELMLDAPDPCRDSMLDFIARHTGRPRAPKDADLSNPQEE